MSAVTQELFDRISSLDEQQQETVLECVRKLPTTKSAHTAILSKWSVEARELRRQLQEKYGDEHFDSQALLDELREEDAIVAQKSLLFSTQGVVFVVDDALLQRGYELATQLNRPTAYDAQYLAVAERLNCEFWTADQKLFNAGIWHIELGQVGR